MAHRATQYPLLRQRRCVGHWSSSQFVPVAFGPFGQPSNSENHATTIYSETLDGVCAGIAPYFSKGWSFEIAVFWLSLATPPVLLTGSGHEASHRAGLDLKRLMTRDIFLESLLRSSQLLRNSQITRGSLNLIRCPASGLPGQWSAQTCVRPGTGGPLRGAFPRTGW